MRLAAGFAPTAAGSARGAAWGRPGAPESASAKPLDSLGRKCPYTSSSTLALTQPPRACTHLRFVPCARWRLANVCRSPCGVNRRPFPSTLSTIFLNVRVRVHESAGRALLRRSTSTQRRAVASPSRVPVSARKRISGKFAEKSCLAARPSDYLRAPRTAAQAVTALLAHSNGVRAG